VGRGHGQLYQGGAGVRDRGRAVAQKRCAGPLAGGDEAAHSDHRPRSKQRHETEVVMATDPLGGGTFREGFRRGWPWVGWALDVVGLLAERGGYRAAD